MNSARHSWLRWPLADALAAAALAAAAAMRVWAAWATRCVTEPDPAVVGLMARHMAAWKEFPVFFYGQSYMGSLEPMASALMIRLLGSSGFALQLGPALFALAALVVLWRWARDAAGPWGGLAAALFGLFGPSVYFKFQVAARGGYMVALWVNALALWAAARMAVRLREGETGGGGRFLALGILAGVGLWSNLIVVPALAAAALILLHGMGGRLWAHVRQLAAGIAGTVIGLLPWLLYNLRHDWRSLEMSQMSVMLSPSRLLRLSWARFLQLHDDGATAAGAHLPLLLAAAMLAMGGLGVGLAWAQRRRATRLQNYSRAAAILFSGLFVVVFIVSGFAHIATGRYWIPLVPGFAVLAAVACASPGGKVRRAGACLLLAVLVAVQGTLCVQATRAFGLRAEACLGAFRELALAVESTGADALLAPPQLYALNFENHERVPVSDGRLRFYEPNLRAAELADAPAYTSDYLGVGEFLMQHRARWKTLHAAGRGILWDIRPRPVAKTEISREAVASVLDGAGADWREILTDRNLDTGWSPGGTSASLEWTFAAPQDVDSIRLVFSHGMTDPAFDFARQVSIDVRRDGRWQTVRDRLPVIPLEWSGPHVYHASGLARLDIRVNRTALEGLRVSLLETWPQPGCLPWHLGEAMLYAAEEVAAPPHDVEQVDELGQWLRRETHASRVYAPRWVSNQLLKRGWLPRERLPGLSERIFPVPDGLPSEGRVRFDRPSVFVVESPHRPATQDTLESLGGTLPPQELGPWSLFVLPARDGGGGALDSPVPAIWTGEELLVGHTAAWASALLDRLRSGATPSPEAAELLRDLIRWRPAALSALTEEEAVRWGGADALDSRRRLANHPERPQPTWFANGVCLEGIQVEPADGIAGDEVRVNLYWSIRAEPRLGRELVFLHLRDAAGSMVAQSDGRGTPLIWGPASRRPVLGEQVVETRRFPLPAGYAGEPLDLSIGIYRPRSWLGRRVRIIRSDAPEVRRHAATWPAAVHGQP